MAFIPDEAIDRLPELSKGARLLYVFLARCRNQKNGRCCPSVTLTMERLDCNRGTVYALRRELEGANWAIFKGDEVHYLFGFSSLKNQTGRVDAKEDSGESLNNQTAPPTQPENSGKSEKSDTDSLKNQTIQSEKSDSHIRNNQQIEPAKNTAAPSAAVDHWDYQTFCRMVGDGFSHVLQELEPEGLPYAPTDKDWRQVSRLRKTCLKTGWPLTQERLHRALANYRASPIGTRTLADFAARFGDFYRHPFDKFGKPVVTEHSAPGASNYKTCPKCRNRGDYLPPESTTRIRCDCPAGQRAAERKPLGK